MLARWDLLRLKDRVLSVAGMLMPADLHSLDAIHLATAQVLGSDLARVVTYDEHIGEGAGHVGLQTASPT